jgi:Arc/MetJ-type ribon-helix-helix transcriptional regulator
MPHPGKVPLKKITLALPEDVYRDVENIVKVGRRWISEADFIRHAVANEVERWKAQGHQMPAGPSPAEFGKSAKAGSKEPRRPAP